MKPGDTVTCTSCGAEGRAWSSSPARWKEGDALIVTWCNGPHPRHMAVHELNGECSWCRERRLGFPSLQGRPLPSEAPWTAGGPRCVFEIPAVGLKQEGATHGAAPAEPADQPPPSARPQPTTHHGQQLGLL